MKQTTLKKLILAAAAAGMLSAAAMPAMADTVTSALTGKQVDESIGTKRPIAVMFNNIYDAVPQYGIEKADIRVEAEVEGLITRIMGIMEDYEDCGRIGSVRSARNYYYYFAREFQAIYCHFGEAAYALPLLNLDSTLELSGLSDYGDVVYYRSDDRESPHNVFTNYQMIQDGIAATGIDADLPEGYGRAYMFAADGETITNEGGVTANVVLPGYSYNHARFEYNVEDGLYYRYQYGEPMIDGNDGQQLSCKNIILQYCDSNAFDENGYLWTDVVSGGTGKYITNGKAIDITWEKSVSQDDSTFITSIDSEYLSVPLYTGDFSETMYYDTDGNQIKLNQGQTWICLIRNSAADQVLITDDYTVSSDATDY